ncbi:MAG: thioesterase family protein [Woeseiaceae bacterium]|nr:thioesterase family protein [Woeseiaceae bacterium]
MSKDEIKGLKIAEGVVKPDWIDVNKHMNVAYYVLAFDLAVDDLWDRIGITRGYIESTSGSTFAVESHVTYQRELVLGDAYFITAQILAYDEKRIHQFQRLYHAETRLLSATAEWMNLHVDLEKRRVTRWPDSILEKLDTFVRQQPDRDLPEEAGKQMRISRPIHALGSGG